MHTSKKILSMSFPLMLSFVFSSAFVLLSNIVLANMLDKNSLGIYRFALSMLPFITMFAYSGIFVAIVKYTAQGTIPNINHIVKQKILYSLISSLISLFIAIYYLLKSNVELAVIFIIMAIFIPFYDSFFIYNSYLKGMFRFKKVALYESLSKLTTSALLVVTTLLFKQAIIILTINLLSQSIARFIFFIKTKKILYKLTKKSNYINVKEFNKFAKTMTYTSFLNTAFVNIDKLIIWKFAGSKSLAEYFVAFMIPSAITVLAEQIVQVVFSTYAKNKISDKDTFYKMLKLSLTVVAVPIMLSIVYIILSDYFFVLFLQKYVDILYLTKLASITIPFFFLSSFFISIVNSMEHNLMKISYIYISAIFAYISTFLAFLYFLPNTYIMHITIYALLVQLTTSILISLFVVYSKIK